MKKIGMCALLALHSQLLCAAQIVEKNDNKNECDDRQAVCAPAEKMIHVPSPEWQDQIIYSLMIDHFYDGDKNRNDQGFGLYRPQEEGFYSGGDIPGITQKIDYLKSLGVTTLLISPPVANQWWNGWLKSTGYHGYWPVNFREVDAHYGSLEDYKTLAGKLHENQMYLIQDAVLNHVAPYYEYIGKYDPEDRRKNYRLDQESIPKVPTQFPFNKIDLLNPEHEKAAVYHWTPQITDYTDPEQSFRYQVAFVNDLNTSNPLVRKTLTESHTYWIKEVGVDGFRFDAVKHVEPDFWYEFMNGDDGLLAAARSTGRNNLLTFGESYNFSDPYRNDGEKIALLNLGTEEKPTIKTVFGYPLYNELRRVLNDGGATAYLGYRINAQMTLFPDPFIVPNFINNHDVERFQKSSNPQSYEQAWAVLLTIPGIPVIYQGDEQNFMPIRQAMFKGGIRSDRDHFDQDSHFFNHLQKLIDIRRQHKVFTRGSFSLLQDNTAGPGILAYSRHYQHDTALVVINTSDVFSSLVNLPAGSFPPNRRLKPLFADKGSTGVKPLVTGPNGELVFNVQARSTLVFILDDKEQRPASKSRHWITLDQQLKNNEIGKATDLSGRLSKANTDMLLVINGNLDRALPLRSDNKGYWSVSLPALGINNKAQEFSLYVPTLGLASPTQQLTVSAQSGVNHYRVEDPLGDDYGLHKNYTKPRYHTFRQQMDIKAVQVKHRGPALELTIEMPEITHMYAYPNGFDHVGFHIYFDVSAQGDRHLPMLNAETPAGMRWDIAHHMFCAGNYIYLNTGSDRNNPGKRINLSPVIDIDRKQKTFTFTYDFSALGVDNWHGKKIYITTWDRNQDGLRPLKPVASQSDFGGGNDSSAKILDDILVSIP
ncbi:alpha-amylase family glycosyl hydrolase [Cellvibrio japonicus]|uniref:Cyclomaltodextrin glucanotransferase, putative, cgt13B n=1 Tax=Cellvibrio japonicus (strain Ueda107) TaxID=498211 RepID=B3PEG1_CELJU|nr:alpha-amylase family glycosyl hydrolase [Cellvibrio japonicus]ACE85332.1 cyclomaltodextrin glucanotransferase, putative, cgt13B [Cellvibrio japonicus Ueda107]QEI13534.1 alpha-amylase [Cellvibrio japonicus]QEI17108.1 alpha-amylase [Cellvibrio japonicus]QEI20685.1 alpha-amylase [Cellvibrio japonicus]